MATSTDNLRFYEAMREVPAEALKTINGGRLNGKSDINPVWRIKAMTDTFGPCGIGWKYIITRQWVETYGNESKAFTNIDLFIKVDGEWSDAIPGTGGASIVDGSQYVNDEAYKMSLTDALSVAMKSLGVAASIYFAKDASYETKYEAKPAAAPKKAAAKKAADPAPAPAAPGSVDEAKMAIVRALSKQQLIDIYNAYSALQGNPEFISALSSRKKELNIR